MLFFNQLLDCIEENKLKSVGGQSYLAIGEFYLKQGRFQDAKWMYQRASSSAIESKNLNQLNSAHLGLLSCFHGAGNDEAVQKESQWYKRVTDSIGNNGPDIAKTLSLLIDSYSSEQSLLKESNREYNYRRSQREVQREYGLALLTVLLALAISAIVLLLAYIKKKEQHNVRVKLELDLAGMINQHFIANTMNAIKSLVAQKKNDTADVYLNKFSALLRGVLQQSKNTLIPLGDELQFLRLYIDLEQLRFPGQIEFSLLVDPQIDSSNVLIPAMIMQPIVENSIQHGRKGESGPLNIHIKIFKQGLVLVCLLEDDGIGFEASQIQQKSTHSSFGLELTKKRIKLLGNQLDVPVDFHVENILGLGGRVEGTRVILQIPLTITPRS
jgi:two-component sensor histidine kinase